MKHILTTDHMEIAAKMWVGMPEDIKEQVLEGIRESVMESHDGALPFESVVSEAFATGFHFCMMALESGALVKAGPGKPENN